MDTVKISIVLPVYNAERFIAKTLDSLIVQTYSNIEVVCVNDGSKDESLKVLEDYAQKDARIKVFSQENQGPGAARTKALDNSTGSYIMFCDADDWYEPTMCEEMLKIISENDVDFAMCDTSIYNEDGNVVRMDDLSYYILPFDGKVMFAGVHEKDLVNATLWSKIFKKDMIDANKIYFPVNSMHDDDIFILQYLLHSKSAYFYGKKLYNYNRRTSDSIMAKATERQALRPDYAYSMQNLYFKMVEEKQFDKFRSEFTFFYKKYLGYSYFNLRADLRPAFFVEARDFLKSSMLDVTQIPLKHFVENDLTSINLHFHIVTPETINIIKRKLLIRKIINFLTLGKYGRVRRSVEFLQGVLSRIENEKA